MPSITVTELSRALGISSEGIRLRIRQFERAELIEVGFDHTKHPSPMVVDRDTFLRCIRENVQRRSKAVERVGEEDEGIDDYMLFPADEGTGKSNGAATVRREAGGASLTAANTAKAHAQAKLAELDLMGRLGQVIPLEGDHGLKAALMACADKIVRAFDMFPAHANSLLDLARNGATTQIQFRRRIQQIVADLRNNAASELLKIAEMGQKREAAGPIELTMNAAENNIVERPQEMK